jgi:hypothetical protein
MRVATATRRIAPRRAAPRRYATQRNATLFAGELMRTMTAKIEGTSPYSQSRYYDYAVPAKDKENRADYDLRNWREHCTVNKDDIICIPGMALKMALDATARKLKDRVPGKGTKTWIDYIVGGVVPSDQMFPIGVKKKDVNFIDIWANLDGVRGSGKRGMRRYPIIQKGWAATVSLDVIDNSLPEELIEHYLAESGLIVGIGRFRPEKGGMSGRYRVKSVKWSKISLDAA